MFILDFINGLNKISCEDFDSHHNAEYKHNGCMNCDNVFLEYHDYYDASYDELPLKNYNCMKKHLVVMVRVVLPTKVINQYDSNGILMNKHIYYHKHLHFAFRTDIEPTEIVHKQEKCIEEVVPERVRKLCETIILDEPPEGYD